jgi:hypothetical protein
MKKPLYLIIILSIFACCGLRQEEVERIIEDGVEVVINHLEPYKIKGQLEALYLEKEFSIDTEDDAIAALGLTDIWAASVDLNGNIFLLNSPRTKENLAFKFDSNGIFQKSFLKRGQGPEEVQSPTLPIITEKGEFVITDYFPRKLFYFNFDGEIIKEISFKSPVWLAYPLENGNYFVQESIRIPDGAYTDNLMVLYNHEMEKIQQLMLYREEDPRSASKIKGTMIDRPYMLWAISKGKIHVGNNDQSEYEILVFDYEGNLIRKIRKEFFPVEVSYEYKRKLLEPYEKNPNVIVQDIVKRIYFPKYMPPYQSFFCDDEGRLFVMTFEEGQNKGEYICDIFNPEGQFICSVGLGNFAEWENIVRSQLVILAKHSHLYCIQQKENGYKELMIYKMKWE